MCLSNTCQAVYNWLMEWQLKELPSPGNNLWCHQNCAQPWSKEKSADMWCCPACTSSSDVPQSKKKWSRKKGNTSQQMAGQARTRGLNSPLELLTLEAALFAAKGLVCVCFNYTPFRLHVQGLCRPSLQIATVPAGNKLAPSICYASQNLEKWKHSSGKNWQK